MKHVSTIKKQIEGGQIAEARDALENLLILGPGNVEAMKLLAQIVRGEGRFSEEHKLWQRVLKADREDVDAIEYFMNRQREEREQFYFTDELPDGGRRYLVYPRSLVSTSAIGLLGCLAFLFTSRMLENSPYWNDDRIILGVFMALVLGPWVLISAAWLRSARYIDITSAGIEVATRIKKIKYLWSDLEAVRFENTVSESGPDMNFVAIPKAKDQDLVMVNLSEHYSCIRARNVFIRDVQRHLPSAQFSNDLMAKTGRKLFKI